MDELSGVDPLIKS